jgi:hypothetical protein
MLTSVGVRVSFAELSDGEVAMMRFFVSFLSLLSPSPSSRSLLRLPVDSIVRPAVLMYGIGLPQFRSSSQARTCTKKIIPRFVEKEMVHN